MRSLCHWAWLGSFVASVALGAPHHDIQVSVDPTSGELQLVDRISGVDEAPSLIPAPGLQVVESRDGDTVIVTVSGRLPGLEASEPPLSSGDGAFLPGGSGWLAWDEAASYRLDVRVPSPHKAVATGRLVEEDDSAGAYRAVFERHRPVGPPSLFIGPYHIDTANRGGIRLRTYFHPEVAEHGAAYLAAAATYLARYEQLIGDYPFADFHIVSAPLPVGLGFENLSYISRRIIPFPYMRGRSLAHEILHNWWGNGVYVDYSSGNWAEGLTTYLADHALAEEDSPAAARQMRLEWLRDYAALPVSEDRPITSFTAKRHNADQVIGYHKVAMVFHMLRQRLGDKVFNAGLRQLWQQHRFQVTGWQQVRASFEVAAGRALAPFFDQWLFQAGAPTVALDAVKVHRDDDGYSIALSLHQDTDEYHLEVPVRLTTRTGVEDFTLRLDQPLGHFRHRLPAEPQQLSVDPEYDLLRRLLPGEAPAILRDITLDPASQAVVVGGDPELLTAATALSERLLNGQEPTVAGADLVIDTPTLLIGQHHVLMPLLDTLAVMTPSVLAESSGARVWSQRLDDGTPLLVVSVADGAALRGLVRSLPHYGRRSYLGVQDGQVKVQGVWDAASPLQVDLHPKLD